MSSKFKPDGIGNQRGNHTAQNGRQNKQAFGMDECAGRQQQRH
jgi:hypothetical protein